MAHILIVDDDEAYCSILRDFLQDRGHRALAVFSAASLKESLRTLQPDLLIIDMHMPGGGGPAAMRSFCDAGIAYKPVIICSGMPVVHQEEWARDAGLVNFRCYQKPLDFSELGRSIDELLASPPPLSPPRVTRPQPE
jgi:DNA-binding NtrC family response regulator